MSDIPAVLQHVVDSSTQMTNWALLVGGGSVAAIVSTSYRRPLLLRHRLSYLLFVPGWLSLAYSLYFGNSIARMHLAMQMVPKQIASTIPAEINDAFKDQQTYLFVALLFFAAWLLMFLLNWVFSQKLNEGGSK